MHALVFKIGGSIKSRLAISIGFNIINNEPKILRIKNSWLFPNYKPQELLYRIKNVIFGLLFILITYPAHIFIYYNKMNLGLMNGFSIDNILLGAV